MTRKRWALLVLAAMLVLAVGCGKKADPENRDTPVVAPPANNSQSGSTTPATPAPGTNTNTPAKPDDKPAAYQKVNLGPLKQGEAANVGPLTVTMTDLAVVTATAGLPPNYNFVVVQLTIKNGGKDNYTINPTDHLKMETPEGKVMPMNVTATAQKSPRLQGTIQPGGSASGWLGYMVKAQDGMFKFRFIHPDWGEARWEFAIR